MAEFPSAREPLLRRLFGNERYRELEECQRLYNWVAQAEAGFGEDKKTIGQRVYPYYAHVPEPIRDYFSYAMFDLLGDEWYLTPAPPPAFERMNLAEFTEYRGLLLKKQHFFMNQAGIIQHLVEALTRLLAGAARELPEIEDPSPFTIPLIYAVPEPRLLVEQTYGTLFNGPYYDAGVLAPVAERLYENLCAVSGRKPTDKDSTKPFKHASESNLPLDELVRTYLDGTPFVELFMQPVPLKLTLEDRFNHTHIIGGTGAGKTTLIERLILHDLLVSDDPPSLVVVDPHGDLIQKLVTHAVVPADRLVLIDPRDIHHPPALNVFALNRERMRSYDAITREQVTAGVIQTFDYLFTGLLGADLTAKQGVFFRYVARLMLSFPQTLGRNATILDMLRLMGNPEPYQDAIRALPDLQREFFERDFNESTFKQTKEQIRYRLQAIIENPTIARLFTAPETKLDLFTEMNEGSVILVDTAKDFLKDGSSTFGRLFISLVLQAIFERAATPAHARKPTFLIIDEAASYFDTNIDDLLTEARKYRCGLVLAHQYLDQATHQLRASLAANTGIKFASGLSAQDARAMAPEMRCQAHFIMNQPRLQFAAHIRHVTPQAVSIPIEPGAFDGLPRYDRDELELILERNRERVSFPPDDGASLPAPSVTDTSMAASLPAEGRSSPLVTSRNEDFSTEW